MNSDEEVRAHDDGEEARDREQVYRSTSDTVTDDCKGGSRRYGT